MPLSPDEPLRVAEAVSWMGLRYAVITSVTRDDLPDGGASLFAATIKAVKKKMPEVKVEVLIPDFKGNEEAIKTVIEAQPDVINHNLEAPEAIYPQINRPKENYYRSLKVLKKSKEMGATTKSGLMMGLGEKMEDLIQTFADLGRVACDLLTMGQYLQPTKTSIPVQRYYTPQEFIILKSIALDFGFKEVESGPLVRSSYLAHKMYNSLQRSAS